MSRARRAFSRNRTFRGAPKRDAPAGFRGCREQALQPGRRSLELGRQRSFPVGVTRLGVESSGRGRQRVRQDGAEPREPLAFGPTPELVPPLVGLEDRLLDDVRGVELRAEAAAQLEPDEQQEVIAVVLDRAEVVASGRSHRPASSWAVAPASHHPRRPRL
jgi:hypothetical protein